MTKGMFIIPTKEKNNGKQLRTRFFWYWNSEWKNT